MEAFMDERRVGQLEVLRLLRRALLAPPETAAEKAISAEVAARRLAHLEGHARRLQIRRRRNSR